MHEISVAQRGERRLGHTDVALHPTKQKRAALARQTLQKVAKDITVEARENSLIDGLRGGKQGPDIGNSRSQSFSVLRTDECGNFENTGRANQQLCIANELFPLKDRWQQLFLDVDYNQRAFFGFERTTRHLGIISDRCAI